MQVTEKRGWGAAAPRLQQQRPPIPRYGISPQLAPPNLTPRDRECFNSPIVATPQAMPEDADGDAPDAA